MAFDYGPRSNTSFTLGMDMLSIGRSANLSMVEILHIYIFLTDVQLKKRNSTVSSTCRLSPFMVL
jgi:hypothetical protein